MCRGWWAKRVIGGDIRKFLCLITSPMQPESPDHRTMTMGVRSATCPKWRKNTLQVHRILNQKTMWLLYYRCGTTPGFVFLKQYFTRNVRDMRRWCSGIMQDSHSCDPGSIPGRRITFIQNSLHLMTFSCFVLINLLQLELKRRTKIKAEHYS